MNKAILTKQQIQILKCAGANNFVSASFYLTGGTALATFYLRHRYSEDLDFFSEKEFDPLSINIFLAKAKGVLGIKKIDFQQSFHRNIFFLHFKDEVIKTEFTYFPFPRIEINGRKHGIVIDSLWDIATNKLFSIYQRNQARDYIDLYCICRKKGYSISKLIESARAKFDWHIDPLQLGTQFIKATEAKDYPRMIIKVSDKKWQGFFLKEAKKLKNQIIGL